MAVGLYLVMLIAMIMFAHYMFLFLKEWQKAQNKISELNLDNFSLKSRNELLEDKIKFLEKELLFWEKSSKYWQNRSEKIEDKMIEKEDDIDEK